MPLTSRCDSRNGTIVILIGLAGVPGGVFWAGLQARLDVMNSRAAATTARRRRAGGRCSVSLWARRATPCVAPTIDLRERQQELGEEVGRRGASPLCVG